MMGLDREFEAFCAAVRLIGEGREKEARESLTRLLSDERGLLEDTRVHKRHIFAASLLRRLDGERAPGNLYTTDFDVPQIELFEVMGGQVPLVSEPRRVANEVLSSFSKPDEDLSIVDLGIGTGKQMADLIRSLAMNGREPGRAIRVVGVEPSSLCLSEARRSLAQAEKDSGLAVEFVAIEKCAEDLTEEEWGSLRVSSGVLLVNAAFALHHVRDEGSVDRKDGVLKRVRALGPDLLLLIEPAVDHQKGSLETRFRNCWRHFGLAFDVIDSLDLEPRKKAALKFTFFAREIVDVLRSEDDQRTERHETPQMWLSRLRDAGFTPVQPPEPARSSSREVAFHQRPGHLTLDRGEEPIVAIMAAS